MAILVLAAIVFQIITDGLFLTPRNLTNLSVQAAMTAMLAAGIVMIMVPAHIDLSIGSAVAVCGVVAAQLSLKMGIAPAIVLTILVGCTIGLWHAFWIAWLGVPSFIVTLASLLGLSGLALILTNARTVVPDPGLLWIANDSIGAAGATLIFALLVAGVVLLRARELQARRASGDRSANWQRTVLLPSLPIVVISAAAVVVATVYRGLPVPVALMLGVAVAISVVLQQTRFGRHLYALGGNPTAARLSGISVKRHTAVVFVAMGALYAIAGLMLTTRVASAAPDAGSGLELAVIAAAVIGGTSLLGGSGTVGGAIMGALLTAMLANGMGLLNVATYYESIVVGLVLLVAVYIDINSRRSRRT